MSWECENEWKAGMHVLKGKSYILFCLRNESIRIGQKVQWTMLSTLKTVHFTFISIVDIQKEHLGIKIYKIYIL